jgi:hypothetical protein
MDFAHSYVMDYMYIYGSVPYIYIYVYDIDTGTDSDAGRDTLILSKQCEVQSMLACCLVSVSAGSCVICCADCVLGRLVAPGDAVIPVCGPSLVRNMVSDSVTFQKIFPATAAMAALTSASLLHPMVSSWLCKRT